MNRSTRPPSDPPPGGACPSCGSSLAVAEERCPACGSRPAVGNPETVTIQIGRSDSVVYLPDDTTGTSSRQAVVPTTVVGPRASLSHLGMEGGVTLEQPATPPERVSSGFHPAASADETGGGSSVHEVLAQRPGEEKYVVAGEIARGGMGVILRAVDRDIRRDVAMKILLSEGKDRARERFVEEAQITGQLEHPNIVPVHDLGVDTDGRLFFTMKLVKGRSLAEILDAQRSPAVAKALVDDPAALPEHRLGRMLTTYLTMLNAIAFAHDRGVVHRDLKPGNVMVGDFGEVLVMDWGLAKVSVVRSGSARQWTHQHVRATTLGQLAAGTGKGRSPLILPDPGRQLATDEKLQILVAAFASQDEAVDGRAIEGTPAYMAPEQARGELAAVDERSDIYSLGAILYEILTLSPPIRGRSVRAILEDVVAGRILAPHRRAPERSIAPELAAIAMKALATAKEERYQTVLELRRDIELYLDDRQVSAKEDSTWEALVKLYRRNQEVVAAIAVCMVIVIGVTIFLFNAILNERHKYQQSAREAGIRLGQLKVEQERRAMDQRRAAPALVAKAQRAVDLKDFTEAQADIDLAIQYDGALGEARMLAAQLAIRAQDWPQAEAQLALYVPGQTADQDGRALLDLVRQATRERPGTTSGDRSSEHLIQIASILVRQGAYTIAETLYRSSSDLIALYRFRLEKQWPGCTALGFKSDQNGRLTVDGLANRRDVKDLSALEGMPIQSLNLAGTQVFDLEPLRRMPLTSLTLSDTPVRSLEALSSLPLTRLVVANTLIEDLSPLVAAPLEELDLTNTKVVDLAPIEKLPLSSLKLGQTRVADVAVLVGMPLTHLELGGTRIIDLTPLSGLKLAELDLTGTLVADLRPIAGMRLTSIRMSNTRITDLAPLRGMPLRMMTLSGTAVANLEPLKGMPLTALDLSGLPVDDLAPLVDLPLTALDIHRCPVTSLTSLAGAKLSTLVLSDTGVTDLTPLRGMPLTTLDLTNTPVTNLEPLANLPLTTLVLDGTPVADITALRLLPLKELRLSLTRVTDLRPLCDPRGAGNRLERLILPPAAEGTSIELLHGIPSLRQIGMTWDGSWARTPSTRDFWHVRAP